MKRAYSLYTNTDENFTCEFHSAIKKTNYSQMKIRIIPILKILFTTFLLIGSLFSAFSQGNDSIKSNGTGLFIGLSAGPSQTQLKNEGASSVTGIISKKMNSFSGSAEIGYFFLKYIGVSSGIGFASYETQVSLDNYQNKFNTIDSEKEAYERQVFGTNMKEVQKVGFLSIPICLNIRLPLTKAIGFFLQTGVNLALPLSKNYTSSGTFTYKGYYPAYNVLLENLPAYGFPSNKSTVSEGKLDLKPFNVFGIASAGFDFFVKEEIQIGVAVCYNKSLSNISAYPLSDNFQLSSDVDKVNSFMGGSSKVSAQSMGINISFRYYLK